MSSQMLIDKKLRHKAFIHGVMPHVMCLLPCVMGNRRRFQGVPQQLGKLSAAAGARW